mmetsp:Transcript_44415/g.56866  ORF Transcript_44415/g.56866 Transcript_44415/m.56866 type:complete len:108 (+) Transcript_44415:276-599(+)
MASSSSNIIINHEENVLSNDQTYFIKISGNILKCANLLFRVGKSLPGVGNLCGLLQELVEELEALHGKVKDLIQVLRRVVDVSEYLQGLSSIVELLSRKKRRDANVS